jgi:outer membrane protein OmpA-like peptidoglycan-associated protein
LKARAAKRCREQSGWPLRLQSGDCGKRDNAIEFHEFRNEAEGRLEAVQGQVKREDSRLENGVRIGRRFAKSHTALGKSRSKEATTMLDRIAPGAARAMALGCVALVAVATTGCATKGFVRKEIQSAEARTDQKLQPTADTARSAQSLASDVDARARRTEQEVQLARDLALGNVKREEVRRVTVSFGFDRADLPEEAMAELDAVAADLQSNLNYMGLISGYTDATGDEEYNVLLGQRRAGAVQRYLAERLGSEFVRLATIGFGETLPVADNSTSEGRALNRRTEVILVRPAPASEAGREIPTAAR